jgi:putative ABC transport system permease protein
VAVISHDYWQTRLGGLDSAVGSEIFVNGASFAIVGVTPPGFSGALQLGAAPALTLPLAHQALVMRQGELLDRGDYWWLYLLGRLSDGATREQAQAAAALCFAQSLEADLGVTDSPLYVTVLPGAWGMTEARSLIVRPLMTVVIVVVAVLLIACVNLATCSSHGPVPARARSRFGCRWERAAGV